MWIIVSKACDNCGGDIAIKATPKEPDEDTIKETEAVIGGMHCIETHFAEIIENEEPKIIN